ncbi:MAG: hypothetical protein AAF614_24605 [Chloroflexota bacterium]
MLKYSQKRLTELRYRALREELTTAEQSELSAILQAIETEEAEQLAPTLASLAAEQKKLTQQLQTIETSNDALATLRDEQAQLVAEAKLWLQQFQQRHLQIRQTYHKLTGESLSA